MVNDSQFFKVCIDQSAPAPQWAVKERELMAGLEQAAEAARIDGCGEYATFLRVAAPLSKGLLGMLAFFSFTAAWANFFLPYVLTSSGDVMPLPVGLGVLFSSTPALNPALGATILPIRQPEIALVGILVAIPILLVFLFSAKFLTRGMMAGAIKSQSSRSWPKKAGIDTDFCVDARFLA